jgi:hypothetical protein
MDVELLREAVIHMESAQDILKRLLIEGEYDFMQSHKDEPKLDVVLPRPYFPGSNYMQMWEASTEFKGVYIKPLWPSIEEIKQAEIENPDCIVAAGYGCIYLYPKFD